MNSRVTASMPKSSICARSDHWIPKRLSTPCSRTHRAVIIDEGWKTGSISAEIMARIMENAFYELDAPVARVCSVEVPMPYPKHLEDAAIPQVPAIIAAARRVVTGHE